MRKVYFGVITITAFLIFTNNGMSASYTETQTLNIDIDYYGKYIEEGNSSERNVFRLIYRSFDQSMGTLTSLRFSWTADYKESIAVKSYGETVDESNVDYSGKYFHDYTIDNFLTFEWDFDGSYQYQHVSDGQVYHKKFYSNSYSEQTVVTSERAAHGHTPNGYMYSMNFPDGEFYFQFNVYAGLLSDTTSNTYFEENRVVSGTVTASLTYNYEPINTACNPAGEPTYDPATEDGVFLWREGNVWHLRAVAGLSGSQSYIGSIASDMGFVGVTPVDFEQWGDNLDTSNPQKIEFKMNMMSLYFDGIDFEVPAGATVSFDVQASNGDVAGLVYIGGDRCVVGHLPYELPSDSSTACSSDGEPTYDPATEDGVFLWQEGNVWHLRAVAGLSGSQSYIGSIASDMGFVGATPVNFEQWGDALDTSNPQKIEFKMNMSGPYLDGIDFEVPVGASVYFDVQASSGDAAGLVFIGGNRCPVGQLPYQLP